MTGVTRGRTIASGEKRRGYLVPPPASKGRASNRGKARDMRDPQSAEQRRIHTRKVKTMKKIILSLAVALAAPFAWSQVSETTTTTTTEAGGTITTFTPGSSIVLRESTGPRTYHFGKKVVYVTKSGKELDEDAVRTRVKVGVPVHVHYAGEGDNMMVDRVVLDED